jgi:hypothetical protein
LGDHSPLRILKTVGIDTIDRGYGVRSTIFSAQAFVTAAICFTWASLLLVAHENPVLASLVQLNVTRVLRFVPAIPSSSDIAGKHGGTI